MVEICGVKFMEGTSKKSGKPYKAYLIHYTEDGAGQGFDGFVTGDAFIDVSLLNGRKPSVGDRVELFYNKQGFLLHVQFVA